MPASARPLQLELSSGAGNRIEEGESPVQSRRRYMPAVVLGCLLAGFLIIESFIPLGTAVQIGADEGFELAKATLCLKGHRLYTEVWNDQPPLHTFLVTQILKHVWPSILGPRLLTIGFALLFLSCVFIITFRTNGMWVAGLTTALVIASPGFLELSSSCMLEIPALATAVSALCILLAVRQSRWFIREILAGAVFALGVQIKLVPVIYVSLAALIIWFHYGMAPNTVRRTLQAVAIFGTALLLTYVATDFVIERGAYLIHFQQSWTSHFAPAKSFEYGSAGEHPFQWVVLLKNWDVTVPALLGFVLLLEIRSHSIVALPCAWLALSFLVFGIHKPWWPYYYIHTAIPLCWFAGIGLVMLWRRNWAPHKWVLLGLLALFSVCAISWMGARLYLQVTNLRRSPKVYSSPVITQMKHYEPFTEWLYADKLVYSFYSGIPMVPSLAVVPIKRMWSGEMTNARMIEELGNYKPGLILLNNDGREPPFKDVLQAEYQLVYMDPDNRLYAHRTIAKLPRHTTLPAGP
jgi:4-amino-4-deoxy-L-arabinose transferase-like glycosyltransferase